MDMDNEFTKLKLLLLGIALFVVSTFMSCTEVRYAVWGRTVDTSTFSKKETRVYRRRGGDDISLAVQYQFDDSGKLRKEEDQVAMDFEFASPNTVTVQYIPGSDSSRLKGHSQQWWLFVFAGSIGAMAWGCFKFWRFYKS